MKSGSEYWKLWFSRLVANMDLDSWLMKCHKTLVKSGSEYWILWFSRLVANVDLDSWLMKCHKTLDRCVRVLGTVEYS